MINIEEYFKKYYRFKKNPSLDTMKYFMNEYNNLHEKMNFIHIAGTNGKGSCSEIINNILIEQGYNVGKFISPHLIRYNERISVNKIDISDEELTEIIEELEPKIKKYTEENNINVTFFEITTIIALLYFYRKNVDFVILETGIGGLHDCTNIITKPLVSIITSIGYDHMNMLGNTLTEIAYQKAGIIKQNSDTVVFEQSTDVNNVFIEECNRKNNRIHIVLKNEIKNYKYDDKYQYFDYGDMHNIIINLKGEMQVQNASICIEATKILNNLGYKISQMAIRQGLKTVIHRGRMDTLSERPLIIYDGAHNESAIKNLQKIIGMYYSKLKRVYIISILKRKNYEKMLELLLQDNNAEFILTSGDNSESFASSEDLYNVAIKYNANKKIYVKTLEESLQDIMKNDTNTINFIVGSFYTYGPVVNIIKNRKCKR